MRFGGGGAGVPGGSSTHVQYNDSGAFGGEAAFVYDKTTNTLTVENLTLTNDLPVAEGGTGASSASAARTNLGVGTSDRPTFAGVVLSGGLTEASSTGSIANLSETGAFTYATSDTSTLVHHGRKGLFTLASASGVTNKTVHLDDIDTTNTNTTGLTTTLWRRLYGGTELARLTSSGNLGIGTASPLVALHVVTGSTIAIDTYANSGQGSGVIMRKARGGSESGRRRTQSGDNIGLVNARGAFAVDDSTDAPYSSNNSGRFQFTATEAHTSTGQGAEFNVGTIAVGSTTTVTRMVLQEYGLTLGSSTVARSTTNPTNALTLADGTAPVGTLTNAVQLYSTAGELRVMDSAGNATLLSPHDDDGNWIHDEINYKGRKLRVDMERLVKAVDALLGGGYVTEVPA